MLKRQVSAGVIVYCIREQKREYLLLHYLHGHWDLAKGKLETGESKQQAALRELQEETGLMAEIMDGFEEHLFYFFRQKGTLIKKDVYFFVGEAQSKDVVLSDEHVGFAWLSYEQAMERLSFKNARELLEKAESFLNKQK